MRKLEVVLLLASLGLGQYQIARSCSNSQRTVRDYLAAAHAAGVGRPMPADWDDAQVERRSFLEHRAPPANVGTPAKLLSVWEQKGPSDVK